MRYTLHHNFMKRFRNVLGIFTKLTLCLLVPSADNLSKQFGAKSVTAIRPA